MAFNSQSIAYGYMDCDFSEKSSQVNVVSDGHDHSHMAIDTNTNEKVNTNCCLDNICNMSGCTVLDTSNFLITTLGIPTLQDSFVKMPFHYSNIFISFEKPPII